MRASTPSNTATAPKGRHVRAARSSYLLKTQMLPPIYLDADARNVTPACPIRQRVGLGFDIPGQPTIRIAITLEHAAFLARYLNAYVKSAAGDQAPISRLISSEPMSVPSEGG
jgi:hypothetical protein